MPTYLVHSRADALTAEQRRQLAVAITEIHHESTGAPRSFVQCVFLDVAPDRHFVGGEPADPRGVWVHGLIRSGREAGVRTAMTEGIRDSLIEVAGLPAELVWVYLTELAHTDMIEFGRTLPPPGGEAEWIADLPAAVRDRLPRLH